MKSLSLKGIIVSVIQIVIFAFCLTDGYSPLECLAIITSSFLIFQLVNDIGEKIVILETIQVIATIEILLLPALFYHFAPYLMPTDSNTYFQYTLPATIAMVLGFRINVLKLRENDHTYFDNVKIYLRINKNTAIYLIITGFIAFVLQRYVPPIFNQYFVILSFCFFTGIIYLWYSPYSYKIKLSALLISFFLISIFGVLAGMFGEIAYWIIWWFIMLTVGNRVKLSLVKKLLFILVGLYLFVLLQAIKGEYRAMTWSNDRKNDSGSTTVFTEIAKDRFLNSNELINKDLLLLGSFTRLNQGNLLGEAIDYVPKRQPFVNGEIFKAFILPVIPRILWKNKPILGHAEYIDRFTKLVNTDRSSINISPLGEAYVNFGYGGILFMFFYGVFFKLIYQSFLYYSRKIPSLFLWLPCLFLSLITCMEGCFLTNYSGVWNSLIGIGLIFLCARIIKFRI
jgi:hypothetical protein